MLEAMLSDGPRTPDTLLQRRALIAADPAAAAWAAELEDIGSRLGTADERPDDEERAHHLAHQLRNLLCLLQ